MERFQFPPPPNEVSFVLHGYDCQIVEKMIEIRYRLCMSKSFNIVKKFQKVTLRYLEVIFPTVNRVNKIYSKYVRFWITSLDIDIDVTTRS